ncbi:MAG: glycosyltransferase [Planctomycetota bacterium]
MIPTGVDLARWAMGSRDRMRTENGIPRSSFVVGHVGRLAAEKNLIFLSDAVSLFLSKHPQSWFMVAGQGANENEILTVARKYGVADRVICFGVLDSMDLCDFYKTLDVFVFASKSETQGLVLAEAMAAGNPVVAVDACGVRETVKDRVNGRLLRDEDRLQFAEAIEWITHRSETRRAEMSREIAETSRRFSLDRMTGDLLALYRHVRTKKRTNLSKGHRSWNMAVRRVEEEAHIWGNFANAIGEAMKASSPVH